MLPYQPVVANHLFGERPCRWGRGVSGATVARPSATERFGGVHEPVDVDLSRRCQYDVAWRVLLAKELPHLVRCHRGDGAWCAKYNVAQWVLAEVKRHERVINPESRLVFVQGDFFKYYAFFGFKIFVEQGGSHYVGHDVHERWKVLGDHRGIVDGGFFGGGGVVVGAYLVEVSVHITGRPVGRTLEHHVFEEVAHA